MTLRMVAEKAGVAIDTARKVIRGDPTVRPYIRKRVSRVISETGYRPNLLARGLRQNHLDLVPLTIMSLHQPFFGRIAKRMSELIVDWGAEPVLCLDSPHLMTICRSYATRGCITMHHIDEADLQTLAQSQRVVVVNQPVPHVPGVSEIKIDFEDAYRSLTEAVVARGRRRIAIVSQYYLEAGRMGWPRQKFPAVFEKLSSLGLASVGPEPGHVFASAAEFGAWLKRHPGGADAALCENDHAGAIVIGELARLGLTTPQDILVAGCDADLPVPGMWSIYPDTGAIAAHAISLLRAMVDENAPGERITLLPQVLDDSGKPLEGVAPSQTTRTRHSSLVTRHSSLQ